MYCFLLPLCYPAYRFSPCPTESHRLAWTSPQNDLWICHEEKIELYLMYCDSSLMMRDPFLPRRQSDSVWGRAIFLTLLLSTRNLEGLKEMSLHWVWENLEGLRHSCKWACKTWINLLWFFLIMMYKNFLSNRLCLWEPLLALPLPLYGAGFQYSPSID